MGIITRSAANNITTGGVILPAAINNASVTAVTALSQLPATDNLTLISAQSASGASSIAFTSGIDSTYKSYLFNYSIHLNSYSHLRWNASADSGSNYNLAKHTAIVRVAHNESGADTLFNYQDGQDLANGTGDQYLLENIQTDADVVVSGNLFIYNPSSSSKVKHFVADAVGPTGTYVNRHYSGGYINSTSAVNAIIFRAVIGTITGTVEMYGLG